MILDGQIEVATDSQCWDKNSCLNKAKDSVYVSLKKIIFAQF